MLAKSMQGKSFGGLTEYLYEGKLEERTANFKRAELITHSDNLRVPQDHKDLVARKAMVKDFQSQAAQKIGKELKNPVGHHVLSFDPKDKAKLSDEKISELTKEYIKERGLSDTQYVAVRHFDTKHDHVHIAFNRVDNSGKTLEANRYFENSVTSYDISKKHGLTIPDKLRDKIQSIEKKDPNFRENIGHRSTHKVNELSKTDRVQLMRKEHPIIGRSRNMHHLKLLAKKEGVSFASSEAGSPVLKLGNKSFDKLDLQAAFKANREEAKQLKPELVNKPINDQGSSLPDYQQKQQRQLEILAQKERARERERQLEKQLKRRNEAKSRGGFDFEI